MGGDSCSMGSIFLIHTAFATSDDASLCGSDKIREDSSLVREVQTAQFFYRLSIVQPATIDLAKSITQGAHLITRESSALEADDIQAARPCWVTIRCAKWRYILHDLGTAADDAARADSAELMYRAQAAKDRVIADHHMSSQCSII